ncbi:endonuclease/exonuclease/phosphatase family protein [Devosia sp.]|uniref:endonuclease/exonuclease/phosphatase family protein n=1 Tax=Devosia sp. TaxID=1871048 RepID=UPI00292E93BE|nr:endonuclease/exonuclease/phosphatase family protein [Devosia sp.]
MKPAWGRPAGRPLFVAAAMEKVTAAIFAEDPDIIVLQEYFGEQATDLHPLLLAKYPFFVRCKGGKRANLGLYARMPFVQVDDGACPNDAYGTTRTAHILATFPDRRR